MNATALVAAIGDGRTFSRSRDLSAWLGLVPRQATTGGKPKLLGITKRGSKYLRKLIIQGARAALPSLARTPTPLGAWLRGLLARAHDNTVVVALVSKTAWRFAARLRRLRPTFTNSITPQPCLMCGSAAFRHNFRWLLSGSGVVNLPG